MAAQIDRLHQIIFFLAVTIVFVVGCWLAEDNLRSMTTRRPRVEFCPLHRLPVSECRDRHKLDGESDGIFRRWHPARLTSAAGTILWPSTPTTARAT